MASFSLFPGNSNVLKQSCLCVCTCIYAWVNVFGDEKDTTWAMHLQIYSCCIQRFSSNIKVSGTQMAFLDLRAEFNFLRSRENLLAFLWGHCSIYISPSPLGLILVYSDIFLGDNVAWPLHLLRMFTLPCYKEHDFSCNSSVLELKLDLIFSNLHPASPTPKSQTSPYARIQTTWIRYSWCT